MSHVWIFDVLSDLKAYAEQNGLPRLAEKTAEVLAVARDEIDARKAKGGDDTPPGRMN